MKKRTQTDLNVARKYFWKRSNRLFDKEEDREDYVSECMLLMCKARNEGKDVNVALVAKEAIRPVWQKQYGMLRGKRYEYGWACPDKGALLAEIRGLVDIMDSFVPANPNDAIASKPHKITWCGKPFFLDSYDVSELLQIKTSSISATKRKRKPIVVWYYQGRLFPNIAYMSRQVGIREGTIKQRAQKIVLEWA